MLREASRGELGDHIVVLTSLPQSEIPENLSVEWIQDPEHRRSFPQSTGILVVAPVDHLARLFMAVLCLEQETDGEILRCNLP